MASDRISSLQAGIVIAVILEENWDGKGYFLKAKITTESDEFIESMGRIRGNQEESKNWEEMMEETQKACIGLALIEEELWQR